MEYLPLLNLFALPALGMIFTMYRKMIIVEETAKRIRHYCCLYTLACPCKGKDHA